MTRDTRKQKAILTTGTIFNSEEEMSPYVSGFRSSCTLQIKIDKMFDLRKKIFALQRDNKLFRKSTIYYTLSKEHDHAHIHLFSNDYKVIVEFHSQLPSLSEYMYGV